MRLYDGVASFNFQDIENFDFLNICTISLLIVCFRVASLSSLLYRIYRNGHGANYAAI